jgi:hypothetical protein
MFYSTNAFAIFIKIKSLTENVRTNGVFGLVLSLNSVLLNVEEVDMNRAEIAMLTAFDAEWIRRFKERDPGALMVKDAHRYLRTDGINFLQNG